MTVHVFVLFLIMAMRISVACRLPSSYGGSREMGYVCLNVGRLFYGSCKPRCEDGHLSIHGAIYLQYQQWSKCSGSYRIEDVTQNIINCISHDRNYCYSWSRISPMNNPKPYTGHKTLFINYTCSENSEEYSAETGDFVIDSGSGMDNMTDYDPMLEMDQFTNLTDFNSTYEWLELITEPPTKPALSKSTVKVASSQLPPDVNSNSYPVEQHGDNDEPKKVGQAKSGFSSGDIGGIVIGTLVCVGGLVLLVVLILLRQRRLSKGPNDAYENHDMIYNTGVVCENVQSNYPQSLTSEHTPNNDNNEQSNYTELMAHNSSQTLSIYTELTTPPPQE